MNYPLLILEFLVLGLGLGVLLADLWLPAERRRALGYAAAGAVGLILLYSLSLTAGEPQFAFGKMYVLDGLALFFKRFFLLAAFLVLLIAVEFSDRIAAGISEYYALIVFALAGMMFAASANDFALLFVSIELIAITFYILTSFQRGQQKSLEAGVKYLILGGAASAFMVFGIALVFGTTNSMNFGEIAQKLETQHEKLAHNAVILTGSLMVLVGLGFKIAAFPFQIWAPDVYQGSPTPTTAFLSVGSKAAGFVLLLRCFLHGLGEVTIHWEKILMGIAAVTILYGSLCAIPQRSLKRLLGYSSIANAGFLLLGVAALSSAGTTAVLYYLAGYLFTVLAAFAVLAIALRGVEGDDISALAGLHQRSPLLAGTLTVAMVSLAGVPPLAGFLGKFLLLKSILAQGGDNTGYYCLAGVALVGVVISFYYYFGVIRAIYWSKAVAEPVPIEVNLPNRLVLAVCVAGMVLLGMLPSRFVNHTANVAKVLHPSAGGAKVAAITETAP
jgi:NADH-quinone oxidoreductase subunit N